jgi:hypothetical protein
MKRSTFVMLLTASVGVAACGSDNGTEPTGDPLTQAEAEALAGILMSQSYQGADPGALPVADGPQLVPVSIETTVDVTVPCALGGGIAVHGTLTIVGDSDVEGGTIDYVVTQTHADCVAQDMENQLIFTLNGNPDMTTDLHLTSDPLGALTLDGGISGTLAWVTGDKSGSCGIEITFEGSADPGTGAASSLVSGMVCGVSISQQVTVS